MADGQLSDREKRLWDEIEKNFGDDSDFGGMPARELLASPLRERARRLFGSAAKTLSSISAAAMGPSPALHQPKPAEVRPGEAKKDFAIAVAVMLAAAAALGVGRLLASEHAEAAKPVALSSLSDEQQLAAKRQILGNGILLIRTATCAEELEAAADGAMASHPSPEEFRAGAVLARQVGAVCFPEVPPGSEYVIEVNGIPVSINGETLPGERNNADSLCGPSDLERLNERVDALPPGSSDQVHVQALLNAVESGCPPVK